MTEMLAALDDSLGVNWAEWLENTPLWVTETNCNHDWPAPTTNTEACQRATGQAGKKYGEGSPATWEANPWVDRIAWWMTTSN